MLEPIWIEFCCYFFFTSVSLHSHNESFPQVNLLLIVLVREECWYCCWHPIHFIYKNLFLVTDDTTYWRCGGNVLFNLMLQTFLCQLSLVFCYLKNCLRASVFCQACYRALLRSDFLLVLPVSSIFISVAKFEFCEDSEQGRSFCEVPEIART